MKHVSLLIVTISLLASAYSQEIKFSGEGVSLWGTALRSEKKGDLLLGDSHVDGKLEAFYDNSSFFAEGEVGFDQVSEESYYQLKEIYLDYTCETWGLRLGRQKAAWGKADGIDITNIVCPPDYSSLSSMVDDDRLAVDSARVSLTKGSLSLDAYFIPFFRPAALAEEDKALLSSIELPEKNLKSSEYGLKVSGYFSFLDLAFYGFYGWEDRPFLSYEMDSQTSISVNAQYERMAMVGVDAAIPLGETVLRLEGAFFPKRNFQTKAEKILAGEECWEKHHNLLALAGLDWMPSTWTFTAQYYCDLLLGDRENLDRSRKFEQGASLNISKSLLSETVKLSASGLLMLVDFDSALELSAQYSLSDSIYLEAGGYIFNEGKEEGKYGAYKDYTSLYIKARYLF